jgi:hypothetical protein
VLLFLETKSTSKYLQGAPKKEKNRIKLKLKTLSNRENKNNWSEEKKIWHYLLSKLE